MNQFNYMQKIKLKGQTVQKLTSKQTDVDDRICYLPC